MLNLTSYAKVQTKDIFLLVFFFDVFDFDEFTSNALSSSASSSLVVSIIDGVIFFLFFTAPDVEEKF